MVRDIPGAMPGRARGIAAALSLGWALTLIPTAARADGVELRWSAPDRCPTGDAFRETVERLLGGSLSAPGRPTMVARVDVEKEGARFRLVLRTAAAEGSGERRLADADCDLLADAAALMVALAIDPVAVLQEGEETGAVQVTPPPPADAPAEDTRDDGRMRLALRLMGGGAWGSLPGVGAGLAGAFGLVWPKVRAEVVGQYWLARQARYDDPALLGVGGDLRLGAAALRVCPTPRFKRAEFPLCMGVEAGAMSGRGVGVERARTRRAVWAAAQAGPAVAWWPSDFLGLWVEVDAVFPFTRPAFEVEGVGQTLHRAQVVGVRGWIGAEVRFR